MLALSSPFHACRYRKTGSHFSETCAETENAASGAYHASEVFTIGTAFLETAFGFDLIARRIQPD